MTPLEFRLRVPDGRFHFHLRARHASPMGAMVIGRRATVGFGSFYSQGLSGIEPVPRRVVRRALGQYYWRGLEGLEGGDGLGVDGGSAVYIPRPALPNLPLTDLPLSTEVRTIPQILQDAGVATPGPLPTDPFGTLIGPAFIRTSSGGYVNPALPPGSAPPPSSWWDEATTLFGLTIANKTLAIGAAAIGVVAIAAGRKGKR